MRNEVLNYLTFFANFYFIDIYKHFLINELKVDVDEADHESCKVNNIISKKIALIKELYKSK